MKIDWESLVLVAAVTLGSALLVVGVVAVSIRAFAMAADRTAQGRTAGAARTVGVGGVVIAVAAVLFGIYLIVPIFH